MDRRKLKDMTIEQLEAEEKLHYDYYRDVRIILRAKRKGLL